MKHKLLSLILATVLSASGALLLASCNGGKGTVITGTTTANTSERLCPPQVPFANGLTFVGDKYTDEDRTVMVAYFEGATGEYTRRSLKADELDQSDVDIATMARDARLIEQLGLELVIETYVPQNQAPIGGFPGEHYQTYDALVDSICSDESRWDIIVSTPTTAASLTKCGYMLNLADLEAWNADYLDLGAPYWGDAYNYAMSYKGTYHWITGDLALRYPGGMYCTFVNEDLYNEHLSAEYGSIYDIAKNGQWTIDLMSEMSSKCYIDNGDLLDERDPADTYGLVYQTNEMIDALAIGMEAMFAYKDPTTGMVDISVMNQRTFDIATKLRALAGSENSYQYSNLSFDEPALQSFSKGNALFTVNTLIAADIYLQEMDSTYMILPLPKIDAGQEKYRTAVADSVTIFGIPLSSKRIPQASAALEFLCAYSSKDVTPLFFEEVLKGKYSRDVEAATMIDLITESVSGDFISIWGSNIDNMHQIFRTDLNLTQSSLKRKFNDWTSKLFEFTEMLDEANEFLASKKEELQLQ